MFPIRALTGAAGCELPRSQKLQGFLGELKEVLGCTLDLLC